jgi:molybdopterin/thiamine biosynthesis adenylyltransferase/rhodanese-related sulfurtransferase
MNELEKKLTGPLEEEISIDDLHRMITEKKSDSFLVDVRGTEERVIGYIKGGVSIPHTLLEKNPGEFLPEKTRPLILYCSTGIRSIQTAALLQSMGYESVRSLEGGFTAWVEAGYDIDLAGTMTLNQARRYSRQMLLQEIGEKGQQKLLKASVLIVGAGGLGSPIGFYLAAAGVGNLGIVDFDKVDISNIHRQILHSTADVGRNKAESAQAAIARINPEVRVVTYRERFSPENALRIMADYDIIVDGSDNFPTKFLLNDAAFFAGKPFIFGAAVRFEGQATVFHPKGGGPCLRCMMPEIPPPGSAFT